MVEKMAEVKVVWTVDSMVALKVEWKEFSLVYVTAVLKVVKLDYK
jgi:hypothetical protein